MPKKSFFERITGVKKKDDASGANAPVSNNSQTQQAAAAVPATAENSSPNASDWMQHNSYEGQLSVDVYQTDAEIVIKSAVAGVDPKDLDISISNDMITIKGSRELDEIVPSENYVYQECYWGTFSRSIILPHEVASEHAIAEFKKGILTIRLPKSRHAQKIHVTVQSPDQQF